VRAQCVAGIGPAKAYQLIKTHGTIEEALKSLDKEKFKYGSAAAFAW